MEKVPQAGHIQLKFELTLLSRHLSVVNIAGLMWDSLPGLFYWVRVRWVFILCYCLDIDNAVIPFLLVSRIICELGKHCYSLKVIFFLSMVFHICCFRVFLAEVEHMIYACCILFL